MEIVDKTEDDIIYVNCYGKKLDYSEEISIIEEKNLTEESTDTFKNIVIDSIEQLKSTIEFLKEEIQEKNLLINTLLLRNANDSSDKVDTDLLSKFQQSYVVETTQADTSYNTSSNTFNSIYNYSNESNKVSYTSLNNQQKLAFNYGDCMFTVNSDDTFSVDNSITNEDFNRFHTIDELQQSTNDTSSINSHIETSSFNSTNTSLITNDSNNDTTNYDVINSNYVSLEDQIQCYRKYNYAKFNNEKDHTSQQPRSDERFVWEKHSTGFASKMLGKMGYQGKGLGKAENGIIEPITINPYGFAAAVKQKSPEPRISKLIYILSDSMLNQMDGTRLSKKYDVTVDCRGGCTIKGMYTRISNIIALKPEYILLHVGTNDCTNKTSDEVLRELECLLEYIRKVLPGSQVIISQPIVRADNIKANQIIKNFNFKLKRLQYKMLDNSNLNVSHLGKRGLHFSDYGTKKMAINIISLIKRL